MADILEGEPSSMNTNLFQPSVALYLSVAPVGTYSVALQKVLSVNTSFSILKGFSIFKITSDI
jgi:hypothetical protein